MREKKKKKYKTDSSKSQCHTTTTHHTLAISPNIQGYFSQHIRGPFQSILDISGLSTLRMSSTSLHNKVSKFSCKWWSISKPFLCIKCHPSISLCAANLWRADLIQSVCFFFLSFLFFSFIYLFFSFKFNRWLEYFFLLIRRKIMVENDEEWLNE